MKFREVRRILKNDGWFKVSKEGSHEQYRHSSKPGKVTVAGKDGADVPTGTLKNIFRQAGL